jgi:Protein of unknown function (DUF2891)
MIQRRTLDVNLASRFALSTLGHVAREYPSKLDQVLTGPADLAQPSQLHPVFFGSFDWHSCVHGWWQLARLARLFPTEAWAASIDQRANTIVTKAGVAAELASFNRPGNATFERPYGWVWLLALHDELGRRGDSVLADILAPLAGEIADRLRNYLPRLAYPIRHGTHANTAFALILALDWARGHDAALAQQIESRAREWFAVDRAAPWLEPSGEDFLSPTLCEAVLMMRILPREEFRMWFALFLADASGPLMIPASVTDRSDGRLAHLDGLNLSRAWCWRLLAEQTGDTTFARASERHLAAALPHIADDYMGEHWLATFALLALSPADRDLETD